MKEIKKIKCQSCNSEFIPRTFHEEGIFFMNPRINKVVRYHDYFKENKPSEVVSKSWVTYCPSCHNVIKFVKEIAKLEKEYHPNSNQVDSKYKTQEFYKPCMVYYDYLEEISAEIIKQVEVKLEEININSWFDLYIKDEKTGRFSEDDFKFMIRFIAKIDSYNESQFVKDKDKTMHGKIKELGLPADLEKNLIELNSTRNDIVHKGYELTEQDRIRIHENFLAFVFYLIVKNVRPLIANIQTNWDYSFLESEDIHKEMIVYLKKYFWEVFRHDPRLANNGFKMMNTIFKD